MSVLFLSTQTTMVFASEQMRCVDRWRIFPQLYANEMIISAAAAVEDVSTNQFQTRATALQAVRLISNLSREFYNAGSMECVCQYKHKFQNQF